MDGVGILMMWLIGIVVFPIAAYIVWRFLSYVSKCSGEVQAIVVISIFAIPFTLYLGVTSFVDKGYCIRDRKYFSEYSVDQMVDNAILLLLKEKSEISLEEYNSGQDYSEESMLLMINNFKSFNDDCCNVYIGDINDGESGSVKYFYKLTGEFYGYVLLEYWQARPDIQITGKQKLVYKNLNKSKRYYAVSRCGEVFEVHNYLYF